MRVDGDDIFRVVGTADYSGKMIVLVCRIHDRGEPLKAIDLDQWNKLRRYSI